jgi:hypothetical protein
MTDRFSRPHPLTLAGCALTAMILSSPAASAGEQAVAAVARGPLFVSAADVARKAAANRAYDEAIRNGEFGPASQASRTPAWRTPVIAGNRSFKGQLDTGFTPSDAALAIGPTRFIQLVNRKYAIYDRASGTTPIATGTLGELANASADPFDPQIMWDPTTKRFYFVMLFVNGSINGILYGWSKTASPNSDDDFCTVGLGLDDRVPNDAKLGDTQHLIVVGLNSFNGSGNFIGADLVSFSKPPAGPACASPDIHRELDLRDTNGARIHGPAPANGIDNSQWTYVVARNRALPSDKLWLYAVRRHPMTGVLAVSNARELTVPYTYDIPADAAQPGFSQKLETLDARPRQAVLARNPARGDAYSLWTNQVVKSGQVSGIRWLEIDPSEVPPTVLRSGLLNAQGTFYYNSAISPDRQVQGATKAFGDSFVIGYTESSSVHNLNPRIAMASSLQGAAVTTALVRDAPGPYRDFSCPDPGDVCQWGNYSTAAPDPKPGAGSSGTVWLTNQYASGQASTAKSNWRSWIWAAKP